MCSSDLEGKLPVRVWMMLRETPDRLAVDMPKYRVVNYGDKRFTVDGTPTDCVLLAMVGIDAQAMRIIGVKSSNHFRADFTPMASQVLVCKSIAPMAADPGDLAWQHLPAHMRTRP